jgi:DNA-binding response OmpR family regulator
MPKKILVVDDEADLVEILKLSLEMNNYEVITAFDGEEGFEKAKKEKPDLILLDIMMPKKDGWTFVREMKMDESIKHIPVIVLTGKDQLKDEFELEGVKDFIIKPVEIEVLLDKIDIYFQYGL